MIEDQRTKILTFDTFVKQRNFYEYARDYSEQVPILLVDRSPCVDPFFDPYASPQDRSPLISGLCRGIKNFHPGDRFLYVARIDHHVHLELTKLYPDLKIASSDWTPHYFGVAALRVIRVWETHATAAAEFEPRQYVVAPDPTPYPPNLAHASRPAGAVARESCIVHTSTRAYTPLESTPAMWRGQIHAYHRRQVEWRLRVAGCAVEYVGGREALQLDPASAPVFTPADWSGLQMTVSGRWIPEEIASPLRERIAEGRL